MFKGISFENTMLVTVTGIVIVFIVLFLLIMIIKMFGKLFSGKNVSGKNGQNEKSPAKGNKAPVNTSSANMSTDPDGELVAVITAAAMAALADDGKKYAVRSIKPAGSVFSSSVWRTAGLLDNTRPF